MDQVTLRPGNLAEIAVSGRLAPGPLPPTGPALWEIVPEAWRTDVSELATEVLHARERERAAAFRFPEDREAYVVAHVGLRLLLGAYLNTPVGSVALERRPCPVCGGPHGRPAVPGDEVHFSLSHTRGQVLFAFALAPVGADVEQVPSASQVDPVVRTLHPEEQRELAALPAQARAEAFGRVWVRKEAFFKGLGTGLSRGLEQDYVGVLPRGAIQPPGWEIRDVAVGHGFQAAVAVQQVRTR
ncbi:4'-phosphopantetheinyl transferase family protein [Streptomyces sp. DT203]|uniref:4'-phosphopantetheinyl transferase family protein n=1 Tax=Streptomyces sp. DT203 TaxID=3393424 RepID=UPI003CEA211E